MAFDFLPYDTTDPSVIFRTTMTSLDSITDIGGADISTGNNLFDPIKGISPKVNGSGISGLLFRLSTMTLESGSHDNLPQCQISFEVERKALSIPASVVSSESNGYDNGVDPIMVLEWRTTGGGAATGGRFYKTGSGTNYGLYAKAGSSGTDSSSRKMASNALTEQWARVTISCQNNWVYVFIDGFIFSQEARSSANNLTQFGDIYLGSYGGDTVIDNWNNDFFIRNFIMSSKPVGFSYHPYLAHIMMVGDSYAAGVVGATKDWLGELNEHNVISRRLRSSGFNYTTYTVNSNGGGTVTNSGVDQLKLDVDGLGTTRAVAVTTKPTFILFVGGANDFVDATYSAAFLPDLKEHVEAWMAAGAFTANKAARKMILICQYTSIFNTLQPDVHADIKSIPAWWDATYPSRAGSVQVVDVGNIITDDGINAKAEYMQSDNLHPNSLGDYIYGNAVADKMLAMLG